MLKKLFSPKFAKFFVSGVSAFAVDTIILSFMTFVIFNGANPLLLGSLSIAKLVASSFGLALNFILNRNWVFEANTKGQIKHQGIKFIIFSVINVLFASIIYNIYLGIVTISLNAVGINSENILKLIVPFTNVLTEGTKMIISFLGYKYFVFRK